MSIQVRLLGEFEITTQTGVAISVTARKSRALLAYLCVRAGRAQQREHLAHLLWGDVSADDYARKSLRQALTVLRRDLPDAFIEATRDEVRVERSLATVDVIEFDHLSRSAEQSELERSIALYRGELLEGFRSRADAFDDWLMSERQRLRERAAAALGSLLELQRAERNLSGATKSAIRLVSLDPLNEHAHRALMQLYAEQGRLGDALDQYENCRGVLERELGHGPEPETVALLSSLRLQRQSQSRQPAPQAESAAQLRVLALLAITSVERAEAAMPQEPALDAAILEHGGSVLRRTSHTTVGVFGARRSQGSEAARALSAAIRVQEAMPGAYACGITYAQAMVTLSDDSLSVVGDAIGQAANLAALADSGAIVISESVRQAVRGSSVAKGIALAPLSDASGRPRAWSVSDDPNLEPSEPRLPFVGRTREVAVLSALLTSCSACSLGQLIVIRGEAGIGKTRLVEQTLALAEREGFRLHRAAALDFGAQHERNIVIQLMRSLLRGKDLSETGVPHLEPQSLRAPASSRDRGLVLELAGLEYATAAEAAELSVREAREERQRQLWIELWKSELAQGPTLVCIEDLHWADAAALDQVADLLALSESAPLLLLISTRPEDPLASPRWLGALRGRAATSLDLGPLNPAESRQLAQELAITDPDEIEAAYERSGGHPLFLEQILKARRPIQLSESIQAVVQTRLDQLGAAEAAALRAAAVLGQQFDLSTLSEVIEGDVPAEGLLRSGLIRRVSSKFLFSHALIRDAVYETLLPVPRRALHARAARAVRLSDRALSAQHLDRAEDASAAEAYLDAARQADGRDQVAPALKLAERGLELASDPQLTFVLTCLRAQLLLRLARRDAGEQAARDALAIAASSAQKARAWVALAECLRGTPRDDEALSALEAAEAAAAPDDHQTRSHIHYLTGSVLFPRGLAAECLEAHRRALAHAKQAGSAQAEARALSGLGDAYYITGDMPQAARHFQRCVALADQLGLVRLARINRVMFNAVQIFMLDEVDRAVATIQRYADEAQQDLDLPAEAVARSAALFRIVVQRNPDQETMARRTIEAARRSGRHRLGLAAAAYVLEAQSRRSAPDSVDTELDSLYAGCSGNDTAFAALIIVGAMLAASKHPERRARLFDEADRLIAAKKFVSHGLYLFAQAALEICLDQRDYERLEHYASVLEAYTLPHGVSWGSFFCTWGRTLAAWQRGQRDDETKATLVALETTAMQSGFEPQANRVRAALCS